MRPVLAQQPLRAQREVRGRRGEPGFLAPRLEERRADDALRHLLDAEHEHAVVLAGPDRARRELQRGAAARAARPRRRRSACRCARARRAPCGPTRRRRTRCRRTRPGTAGRRLRPARRAPRARPCRCSSRPSKRPNGWMPTPATVDANAHVDHSVGQLVGDERHRLAERELRRVGLGEPGDDAQAFLASSSTTPKPYGTVPS